MHIYIHTDAYKMLVFSKGLSVITPTKTASSVGASRAVSPEGNQPESQYACQPASQPRSHPASQQLARQSTSQPPQKYLKKTKKRRKKRQPVM